MRPINRNVPMARRRTTTLSVLVPYNLYMAHTHTHTKKSTTVEWSIKKLGSRKFTN